MYKYILLSYEYKVNNDANFKMIAELLSTAIGVIEYAESDFHISEFLI